MLTPQLFSSARSHCHVRVHCYIQGDLRSSLQLVYKSAASPESAGQTGSLAYSSTASQPQRHPVAAAAPDAAGADWHVEQEMEQAGARVSHPAG